MTDGDARETAEESTSAAVSPAAAEEAAEDSTAETAGGVPTGCAGLDSLLGDGLERGTVTQVYGQPASGKTNIALSSAVATAAAGETVVYIDTEGLSADRFHQIADDYADPAALADRIVISEAHDFEEQAEAVQDVAELSSRAGLVILDSATGFYRLKRTADAEGEALRTIARQVAHLLSLARKHDLAVLVTNQVYTDPDADAIRPLGGHTLAHWTGVILRLDRFRGGNRRATLEKHRSKAAGETVQFRITDAGLVADDGGPAP